MVLQKLSTVTSYFNPRPPRGGRRCSWTSSTTSSKNFNPRPPRGGRQDVKYADGSTKTISIHALREEGDGILLSDAIEY